MQAARIFLLGTFPQLCLNILDWNVPRSVPSFSTFAAESFLYLEQISLFFFGWQSKRTPYNGPREDASSFEMSFIRKVFIWEIFKCKMTHRRRLRNVNMLKDLPKGFIHLLWITFRSFEKEQIIFFFRRWILFPFARSIEGIASNARFVDRWVEAESCLPKQHFMDQKNVRWN